MIDNYLYVSHYPYLVCPLDYKASIRSADSGLYSAGKLRSYLAGRGTYHLGTHHRAPLPSDTWLY